jgi:hypothetical protein
MSFPSTNNSMKSDSVRRGVQTATASRKPGSSPGLGKVARMPGYGRRSALRRRSQSSQGDRQGQERQRHAQVVGWSIGVGLMSLVALGLVFGLWLRPRSRAAKNLPGPARSARVESKFKAPTESEALAAVKKALALHDPAEVDGLIRRGPMTAPEVVAFLEAMPAKDGEIKNYRWLGGIDKNGLSLEGVQVTFAGQDQPRGRLAILTPDSNGVWKLDFAAFARWVKPSWESLLEQQAESAVIRVFATQDNYFNGPFRDEREWAAYKLASPDTEAILVGYCKLGSAQHRAMELLWQRGDTAIARVTLEIRRLAETPGAVRAERCQFEIARVLAEDWVLADKPLDGRNP